MLPYNGVHWFYAPTRHLRPCYFFMHFLCSIALVLYFVLLVHRLNSLYQHSPLSFVFWTCTLFTIFLLYLVSYCRVDLRWRLQQPKSTIAVRKVGIENLNWEGIFIAPSTWCLLTLGQDQSAKSSFTFGPFVSVAQGPGAMLVYKQGFDKLLDH